MPTKQIGLIGLTLLMTGAIDSIRNLPTTALFGPSLILFFILGAVFFLIPTGLISAELASTYTDKGGIYEWTKMAFDERVGVFAIWLQWINTMVWYPSILSFIAGTACFLIDPSLAQNKVYLISVILVIFWGMTIINLGGLNISTKLASWCGFIGMVIPMLLIVVLGVVWLLLQKPLAISFNAHAIFPHLGKSSSWISLTAIIASFLGMELATVHIREVKNAQANFPIALLLSITFILITMVSGSLAIAFVVPVDQINLVDGIMEAFKKFLVEYHLSFFLPILTLMIIIGSIGGMVNWLISPAKGLMQAARNGYLPKILAKENRFGASSSVLVIQAIFVSLFCMAFLLMPSVNGSYWLLTSLSTELYLVMYVAMFCSAIWLKLRKPTSHGLFKIPGGRPGFIFVGCLGIIGCLVSIYIGFIPPSNINVGSHSHYFITYSICLLAMITPVGFFYLYKKRMEMHNLCQQ